MKVVPWNSDRVHTGSRICKLPFSSSANMWSWQQTMTKGRTCPSSSYKHDAMSHEVSLIQLDALVHPARMCLQSLLCYNLHVVLPSYDTLVIADQQNQLTMRCNLDSPSGDLDWKAVYYIVAATALNCNCLHCSLENYANYVVRWSIDRALLSSSKRSNETNACGACLW